MSLRRYYQRHGGYRARFHLTVVLTIFAVAYVVVPPVTHLLESLGGYGPAYYEPKDFERQAWVGRVERRDERFRGLSWRAVFSVALFLLVAALWLTLLPGRPPRRRADRR